MKEIEQIMMRKDIEVLRDKYNIRILNLAKRIGLAEANLRNFMVGTTLIDKNHKKVKDGLLEVKQELKEAEEYKGFDYVDERIKSIQDNISLRKTKGMTQKDVAEKTGLCLRTIAGYECGEKVNDESNRLIESFYTHLRVLKWGMRG